MTISPPNPQLPRVTAPLVSIRNLRLEFTGAGRTVYALRGIDLDIAPGEILAIVGESGSGKSVTGLSILGLHGKNASISGSAVMTGTNLLALDTEALRAFRGRRIAMIFQEPMTALNPVFTVGYQLFEILSLHAGLKGEDAQKRAIELFQKVGIPEPALRLKSYPFQLSGGMRQRILIAMAIAAGPELIIADEPTTALDVTIQAQILRLLREINEAEKTAIMFITHDLGIVAKLAHRVAVMYAGEIVELGTVAEIFESPRHPYTRALLASVHSAGRGEKLHAIPGAPPTLTALPAGCAFAPRCEFKTAGCERAVPMQSEGERAWRCVHQVL